MPSGPERTSMLCPASLRLVPWGTGLGSMSGEQQAPPESHCQEEVRVKIRCERNPRFRELLSPEILLDNFVFNIAFSPETVCTPQGRRYRNYQQTSQESLWKG